MFFRFLLLSAALAWMATGAEARRIALVVGQNAYRELVPLDNPVPDARRMAELLAKHGFEVIACDGKAPGCFDLDRSSLLDALKRLEERAAGADLALVFFAGHGMAAGDVNILGPVDAGVDCSTSGVTNVVPVEGILAATRPARHKLVILDACRNNPLGDICPNLKGKRLSFTRIEAGALQGFLLVTSTQFGQTALDGPAGAHSPFATALFSAFESNPGIYFEQVFNEVARATYEAAQKEDGFLQIPGKVVGGAAPADCLAGTGCVGDARMAALEIENRGLAVDASGVRNLLVAEEQTRGKPYTPEERQKRVAELTSTLARIGTSTDPLDQEGRRRIAEGDVAGGQAKLEEALDADEKAIAEAERVAAERRTKAARRARDLAVLARGTDVLKAVVHYQRATRLDPSDPETWDEYARAALDAGRTAEAKTAFEQAIKRAQESNSPFSRYSATLGLGDVAVAQGDLPRARKFYEMAITLAEPIAKADPGNAGWQSDLSMSHYKIGDVLVGQGNLQSVRPSQDGMPQPQAVASPHGSSVVGKLSGDEVILLWMSIGAGGFGAFRWYWRLSKTGAVVRPGHLFVWLGVVPPLALAGIFIVLKVASSFDVRNSFSYLLLYTTLGASWIFLSAYLMEKAGVSFRDDAVERRNPAAAILVGSAVVAHATIYAGANIGDGPGWWAVVAAGLIGSGVWFLSWSVVELCRSVSEEITVERDVPIAIRLAGFALATGLVCARGSAGDWTSLAQTLIEFRSAWAVLPFTAAAIGLESLLKTKPRSTRPGINGSVIIAICYLALAFAAVHTSGPLPNNPIYDHAAVP